MRKVLFLLSPGTESSLEKILTDCTFSDCSAQGILLQGSHLFEKTFPFPCYILDSGKSEVSVCSPVHYPDMLKMIFEADTVISFS